MLDYRSLQREQKTRFVLAAIMTFTATIVIFIVMAMFLPEMTNAGSLEPSGPPAPTMKTLDEIPPTWSQILPASKRFELVMGGAAVLDKETGLVWEKSPDTTVRLWNDACIYCYQKQVGGRRGWRLPTVEELASLVDMSVGGAPYIPSGHPFSNVQSSSYWSSTTGVVTTSYAWYVYFYNGNVGNFDKSGTCYVWCVRGGRGHDAY